MRLVPNFLRRGPWRRLSDLDVLHTLGIAVLACLASGGLLFIAYFFYTWHASVRAPIVMQRARILLLFGKRLNDDRPDADYLARITRAHEAIAGDACDTILLLGGASGEGTSEAEAARRELMRLGVPSTLELLVENTSIDTLENLRNARELLASRAHVPVALLSSRYHLARCALLARQLGFDAELVAAEPRFVATPARLRRLVLEAGYILWVDVGTRWARRIGNTRMLRPIT